MSSLIKSTTLLTMLCSLKVVQDTIPTCITSDESCDGGYSNSPSSVDRSARGTPGYSAFGRDCFAYCRTDSETSGFSEHVDDTSPFGEPSPMHWPSIKSGRYNPAILSGLGLGGKQQKHCLDETADNLEAVDMELEMMKERFSKLLLGEDMSGSGKGVCTAVTISNTITNLYATVFGHNLRLEPLKPEKKEMWKREMNCLLSVCDYIVEFVPSLQALPDGRLVEAMSSRPRSDICINLPALRKLDAILLEILDSFQETEFWYAEQGSMSGNSSHSGSFRRIVQRKDEKWWLPVPCVNPGGLSVKSRKHLHQKRDRANQIHKAAMAINGTVLDEMEMPDSYLTSLPKSGRAKVGDIIYRYMTSSDRFSADHLLDCLSTMSEHEALDLANRVEAAMYMWRRKACISHSKSSWTMVKDFMAETGRTDKNYTLAERAESLLLSLKQRYPELSQTSLDTSKIQFNKDVGQAILESYSRVLEGLAFNIVAWIEDVLHVDKTMSNSD